MGNVESQLQRWRPVAPEMVIGWAREHPIPVLKSRIRSQRLVSICLWGSAGVGKSALIRGYCKRKGIGLTGYHPAHDNSGSDIVGLPMLDTELRRTVYALPIWLPKEDDRLIAEREGIVFIDELNRADQGVLAGLLELIGEGSIGHAGYELGEGWMIVAACNPPDGEYAVNALDPAMVDRMVHVPMSFDLARWAAWAEGNDVHNDMISFAAKHKEMFAADTSGLPEGLKVEATPRTLEYLARLYDPRMNRRLLYTIAQGLIGPEATVSFFRFLARNEAGTIVNGDDILAGNKEILAEKDQASAEDMLLAALIRREPEPEMVANLAGYLSGLPEEQRNAFWERMVIDAPGWIRPLRQEFERHARPTA